MALQDESLFRRHSPDIIIVRGQIYTFDQIRYGHVGVKEMTYWWNPYRFGIYNVETDFYRGRAG